MYGGGYNCSTMQRRAQMLNIEKAKAIPKSNITEVSKRTFQIVSNSTEE